MAAIFKRKGDERWVLSWFDASGKRRERSSGTTDKRLAQRLANEIEDRELELKRGLIDPTTERLATARTAPLDNHIEAYEDHLAHSQRDDTHVASTVRYLRRAAKALGWSTLAAVNAEALVGHLSSESEQRGTSARTFNASITAWRAFCRWCVKTQRLSLNPLASVSTRNIEEDRRRVRRNIEPDELFRVVKVAASTPYVSIPKRIGDGEGGVKDTTVRLHAPDRAMAYLLASECGLRASEVASLYPSSFSVLKEPYTVVVEAKSSKRRRRDTLPLRAAFAALLREWLPTRDPSRPVVAMPGGRAGQMFAADMLAARAIWIAEATNEQERERREESDYLRPVDSAGRVADFHALRGYFITRIIAAGADLRSAMELARHSTPTLTIGVYARTSLHNINAILDRMPLPAPESDAKQIQALATGTADACPHLGPHSPHGNTRDDATGRVVPVGETLRLTGGNPSEGASLCDTARDAASSDENAPRRTRTFDPLIKSQTVNATNQGISDHCPHSGPHSSAKSAPDAPLADMLARWIGGNA